MSIRAEVNLGEDPPTIDIDCPTQMIDMVRALPGTRVRNSKETLKAQWYMPLSYSASHMLRGQFPQIEFGPNLTDWVMHFYNNTVVPAINLRYAHDAQPPWGAPEERAEWLRGYQKAGIAFLQTVRGGICADEMGTGKTDQIIDTIEGQARLHEADPDNYADPFPTLLVVPEAVRRQWKRAWHNEANHAYTDREIVVADGNARQRRNAIEAIKEGEADVLIIGYTVMRKHSRLINYGSITLRRCEVCQPEEAEGQRQISCDWCEKELNDITFGALALDEGHLAKNPAAKQTRAIWWINEKQVRPGGLRLAATGTPTESNLDDAWGLLHLVQPDEFPVKSSFVERFGLMVPRGDGGLEVAGINPARKDEFHAITDHFLIRRLKKIVQPDLPPKVYEEREARLAAKQKRSYKHVAEELMVRGLTNEDPDDLTDEQRELPAIEPAVASLRLQQAASATLDVQECETCKGTGEASEDIAHDPVPHPDPDYAERYCWCAKPLDYMGPEHRNVCRTCNGWGDTVELVEPSAKLDEAMNLLEGELKGKQVVIFYRFLRLANLLADRLDKAAKSKKAKADYSYFRYDGSTNTEEREVGLRQFEVGETRIAMVSIDAGGTGVDGLQAADTAIYLQRHPSRIKDTQSEDRLHRGGSEKHETVLYLDIVADVPIEDEQKASRARKDEHFEQVMNDAKTLRALLET